MQTTTVKNTVTSGQYDVFISYGRKESKDMAIRLCQRLEKEGLNVWLDQDDIQIGEQWQQRIREGICRSLQFIFIIAPHSAQSPHCREELEIAIEYGKHIVPVMHVEEGVTGLHPVLGERHWLGLRERQNGDAREPVDDFEQGVQQLLGKLSLHRPCLQQHTSILLQALEWARNHRTTWYLPVGEERMQMQQWLQDSINGQVPATPSDLHCEFICEARKNAENMMADVFLAYASEDAAVQGRIKRCLMRNGITTWRDNRDIRAGKDFETAIREGIEQADAVVFLLSARSVSSGYCLKELEYALQLNKRLVPVLIENLPSGQIPESLRDIQYINLQHCQQHEQPEDMEAFGELPARLREHRGYYHKHKQLLVKTLRWDRLDHPDSMLLRGFNLDNAEAWLTEASGGRFVPATALQREFIELSRAKSGLLRTECFISYSRKDGDFARYINLKLQVHGTTTWFDQENIAEGTDFAAEILRGIENSDNFIFLISPASVQSPYCEQEVAHAIKCSKRIIPVLCRETPNELIPEALNKIQRTSFVGRSFEVAFGRLAHVIDTDREHVKEHTYWQQKALDWHNNGHKAEELLGRGQYALARHWLDTALQKQKNPAPTQLQAEFVESSNREILAQENRAYKTRKRLQRYLAISVLLLLVALASLWFGLDYYRAAEASNKKLKDVQVAAQAYINARPLPDTTNQSLLRKWEALVNSSTVLEPVQEAGLYGYKDLLGNIKAPPRFTEAGNFENGEATVKLKINGVEFEGKIDSDGKLKYIVPDTGLKDDIEIEFYNEEIFVRANGLPFMLDRSGLGKQVIIAKDSGQFAATEGGYEKLERITDQLYRINKGGRYGLLKVVKKSGQDGPYLKMALQQPFVFDKIGEMQACGLMITRDGDKWGVIDAEGNMQLEARYDSLELRKDNKNGGCQISFKSYGVRFYGNFSFSNNKPTIFSAVLPDGTKKSLVYHRENELLPVPDSTGQWGFVNQEFDLVIPYQFEAATPFDTTGTYAAVKKNNEWYFMDKNGKQHEFPLVKPAFSHILFEKGIERHVSRAFLPGLNELNRIARRRGFKILITEALRTDNNSNLLNNLMAQGMGVAINLQMGSKLLNSENFKNLVGVLRKKGDSLEALENNPVPYIPKDMILFLQDVRNSEQLIWGWDKYKSFPNGIYSKASLPARQEAELRIALDLLKRSRLD